MTPLTQDHRLQLFAALVLTQLGMGCRYFEANPEFCSTMENYYLDCDFDGLGLETQRFWTCEANLSELYGGPCDFVQIKGDLCEDRNALNWDGIENQPCEFEGDCEPIWYHGKRYDVFAFQQYCWFAQDLATLRYADSTLIAPEFIFQSTSYPDEGFLYSFELVNHTNLCPNGWRVPAIYVEFFGLYEETKKYVEDIGPALRSREKWDVPGDDFWGFQAIPNGTFSSSTGLYTNGLASIWLRPDPLGSEYNRHEIRITESDDIEIVNNPSTQQFRGIRCSRRMN